MIRQYELVDLVSAYNPNTDEDLINRAYIFGIKAHGDQKRANGDPYFGHPLEVAAILTQLHLDDATIVTALLHDTIEDTAADYQELQSLFGTEIADLVDGVTKLSQVELISTETVQAENFRKLLIAMSKDVRVLLVKLADRLHNMRTINFLREEKRKRIAHETMEIFAPLAGRMGMETIRQELEDLSFAVLNPEARSSIMRRFVSLKKQTGDFTPDIIKDLSLILLERDIRADVSGRDKRPYSIWKKMEEKKIGFSQLSDITAFRIITDNEDNCYRALGAVHQAWRVVPDRFKDYISGPKANGYRGLHSTVIGPNGARVEIQIRTHEMHEIAETGVAAHWSYKDGVQAINPFVVDPYNWLKDLVQRLEKGDTPQEFLEHAQLEMLHDQVFCFTPRGDVIGMPHGATPLDFAYAIHTELGNSYVGALVNGSRVPISTPLRNGQMVEIQTSSSQRPEPLWTEFVKSGRARAAIRRTIREDETIAMARMGKQMLMVAFENAGEKLTEKAANIAAKKLHLTDTTTLYAEIGKTNIQPNKVLSIIFPKIKIPETTENQNKASAITVSGTGGNLPVKSCKKCMPLPGERIIGISTPSEGITVHLIGCNKLESFESVPERWIDMKWSEDSFNRPDHSCRISVTISNKPGALGKLCSRIGDAGANIDDLSVFERNNAFLGFEIDLSVKGLKHLDDILVMLDAQDTVTDAQRKTEDAAE